VHIANIFDLDDPREDRALYRLANRLHMRTREGVIRAQLLFAGGEPLDEHKLRESERILRTRHYLNDAWVVAERYDAEQNVVDLAVTVRDVWTLSPGLSIGRSGGSNASRISFEEQNLLGQGSSVAVTRARNVDRTSTTFSYADTNLLRSWWQLGVNYSDNSDGRVRSGSLARPFTSLDTRSAVGFDGISGASVVPRYSNGAIADQFEARRSYFDSYYGWSRGLEGGWTQRWFAGARYDSTVFTRRADIAEVPLTLPEDRRFAYPFLGWQLIEDRYTQGENYDLIGRTEDLYFGRSLYAELGYSPGAHDRQGSALLGRFTALTGWAFDPRRDLFANASLDGRLQDGTARNVVLNASARYFQRISTHQLFYAALTGVATHRLDAERQVLLGGDTGLRGYPLRFQGGTSSLLATAEHRVFTDWYPFRLVRVGGAVFFDAGRTWGRDYLGVMPVGLLKDVGLGLRIGNNRSALGSVLHVDLSYALDGPPGTKRFQVTVETKDRF
jgi:hypothetical protein